MNRLIYAALFGFIVAAALSPKTEPVKATEPARYEAPVAAPRTVIAQTEPTPAPKKIEKTEKTAQKGETIFFARCADAYAAGYKNIPRGQPGYAPHLDRDNDGIACERR